MRVVSILCAGILASGVAACTSVPNPEGKPLPHLQYQYSAPIGLDVKNIDVQDHTRDVSSEYVNYVESVEGAVLNYLGNRFRSDGGSNAETLSFVLEQVSLAQDFRESDNRVGAFLGVAGQDVYQLSVTVHANLEDRLGNMRGKRIHVGRKLFISEHASVAQRDKLQLEGLEALIHSLDEALLESFGNPQDMIYMNLP